MNNNGMFADEYIEYWGQIYDANPVLRQKGIMFITFLYHPQEILAAVAFKMMLPPQDDGYQPLLPEQKAVMERQFIEELELVFSGFEHISCTGVHPVRRSNGQIVEPLAHHRYSTRRGGRCAFQRGVHHG